MAVKPKLALKPTINKYISTGSVMCVNCTELLILLCIAVILTSFFLTFFVFFYVIPSYIRCTDYATIFHMGRRWGAHLPVETTEPIDG